MFDYLAITRTKVEPMTLKSQERGYGRASCMAGMAFANAFLGLNHSMAHKLGAFHHLPHGVANAVIPDKR
ncbi:MAG: iron-containing alcohol dehydrogenase [[Clostridium] scindens]